MIVNFEQDPNAPFGSGNFRDESGRITYLHDPETASDFVTTMPGAKANGGGGAQASPTRSRMQTATLGLAGVSGNAPPAPPGPGSGGSGAGAALVQQQAEADASLSVPAADPAAAGVGATDPAALARATQITPEEEARLNGAPPSAPPPVAPAPAAVAAPTGTGAGAALVQRQGEVMGKLGGTTTARTRPRDIAVPASFPSGDLPHASTSEGETVSVAEGRPIENVLEQLGEEEGVGEAGDQVLRDTYGARINATNTSFESRKAAAQQAADMNKARMAEARQKRLDAEAEQERLNEALKENDKNVDPDRVMRDMSTGKTVAMIFLAGLSGGFGAVIGKKDNDVINAMNRAVDQDIDKQKAEVASGRIRIGNLIDKFMKQGFDAETSEMLARDKLDGALAAYKDLEAQRVGANADLKAQMDGALQARLEARVIRRGEKLAETEAKVTLARRAEQVHAVPLPGALGTPGALGKPVEAGPKIAPVGTEDASQAVREGYANRYNPADPAERGQMTALSQEMGATTKLKQTLERLETAYKVKPDPKTGRYPAHGSGDGKTDYASSATGPAYDPTNWVPNDERERAISDAFDEVETDTRNYWESEPNGEVKQKSLSGINRPKRDSDVPNKLYDLRQEIARRELAAQSGANVTVRSAWKLQNGYPLRPQVRTPPTPPPATRAAKAAEAAANTGGETIGTAPLPSTDGQPKRAGGLRAE